MIKELRPYRLLVIEDNPGDFILLQQYLKRSLLPVEKIVHAEKMSLVPALIKENNFDIALLDLALPDSRGVDSVEALISLLPQTPIIVFSGLATIETAIESISLGAQDYLVKGEFDEKLLVKTIQYSIERKRIIENLRISNELYEFVNKATQDTIWEWNYLTKEGRWGEGIINVFGYAKDKLTYHKLWTDEYIHPTDREKVRNALHACIESGIKNWQAEYRFRCADGSYKYVYDRGFILYDKQGKHYRMIGAMTDVTEKKQLEEELVEMMVKKQLEEELVEMMVKKQKLIIETTIQTQEKERNELGWELHENINPILATVKMYLSTAQSNQELEKELVEKSYQHLNEAIEEIRKLSHTLVVPSLGYFGLHEALEEMVQEINKTQKLKVDMVNELGGRLADKNVELMLYRITQEQMNNIYKYAQASHVAIHLKSFDGNIIFSIADDGVGFDTAQKAGGIGLKNISNRVEYCSGTMNIISAPGKGCTLEISIPLLKEKQV